MKKVIAFLLLLATLFAIVGCRNKNTDPYPPIESTEEEARTVMTLSIDGDTYEVKYELYRAFFLTYKSMVDGGDSSVWTGDRKSEYTERINKIILDRIGEIYAAFAMCKRIGFDLYSSDIDAKIKENVRISIEGGSYGSNTVLGFGSYDAYLAALKAMYFNYSVQTLMFRYAIAVAAIDSYYIGTASPEDVNYDIALGTLQYTKDDVKNFYNSNECARVLRASVQKILDNPLERAEKLKAKLEEAVAGGASHEDREYAVFMTIMGSTLSSNPDEVKNGYVLGKYSLERSYYGEMIDAAFALNTGEVSSPIDVVDTTENSYYILYKTYKHDAHFEACYEDIKYVYLKNTVGEIAHGVAEELKSSASYTDFLRNIDHSKIGM
jgi:predicted small lipoprotein YifL